MPNHDLFATLDRPDTSRKPSLRAPAGIEADPRTDRSSRAVASQATFRVLDVKLAAIHPDAACERILAFARERRSRQVHLCNSYTLTLARRDDELARALHCADLNLPDGAPIAWLGRKAGTGGPVRGPGLVADVFAAGVARDGRPGVRHYLYGGAPGVADKMAAELRTRHPQVEIVGVETPPYRPLTRTEIDAIAERITESHADLVWIGLGTPRQDYLVASLSALVTATLVPVGAAFDFISGRVAEAPAFLHGSGFEWLYRLSREPRRLWRRYLIDGARFGHQLMRSRLRADAADVPTQRGEVERHTDQVGAGQPPQR